LDWQAKIGLRESTEDTYRWFLNMLQICARLEFVEIYSVITPIILCGGSGTRLWPLSRKGVPKQFAPILDGGSLFAESALRVSGSDFAAPVVVTGSDFRFIVTEQLLAEGIEPGAILIEPEGRNTAPAVQAGGQLGRGLIAKTIRLRQVRSRMGKFLHVSRTALRTYINPWCARTYFRTCDTFCKRQRHAILGIPLNEVKNDSQNYALCHPN